MEDSPKFDDFEGLAKESEENNPEKGRWSSEQRLEFIEFRLGWEGRINRADLTRFFNTSVPQASLDLARYRSLAPRNLVYDAGLKVYLKADSFEPLYQSSSSDHYLNDLWALHAKLIPREACYIGWLPPLGTVPTLGRMIVPEILFKVLLAIREKKKLKVEYLSFSRAGATIREISPHALSNDGFRWHTRAYCEERSSFRDFVIARILKVLEVNNSSHDATSDKAWNNFLLLELIPHPSLPEPHKKSVEFDYSMSGGKLKLECREALIYYAIKKLDLNKDDTTSSIRHLYLSNHEEIENALTQRHASDGSQMSLWDMATQSEE